MLTIIDNTLTKIFVHKAFPHNLDYFLGVDSLEWNH